MQPFGKTLLFFAFALGIGSLSAKPLTAKQAQDAAARIDSLLGQDLKTAKQQPLARIDDGSFLRRAYLGIIGRIPTEEEARAFLENRSPARRQELVDALVASPGFDSHLFNWTADLLRVQTGQQEFGLGWHVWLRESLAADKPWDVMVREMLSASGHAARNPAVGYYLRDRAMQLDNFSNSMQVFLGRQIGCAQCHDHPFDDWTQHEYYQMAAFGGGFTYRSAEVTDTTRRVTDALGPPMPPPLPAPQKIKPEEKKPASKVNVEKDPVKARAAQRAKQEAEVKAKAAERAARNEQVRKRNEAVSKRNQEMKRYSNMLKPLYQDFNRNAMYDDPAKLLKLPDDYAYRDAKPKDVVPAETLFGEELKDVPPAERRAAFAKWVTSRGNPYFTKVIANRLWARAFGHGLQDPVDDWNDDSKPSHPQVMAFLEEAMKAVDYDLRQFSRILYRTDLFQRENDPVEPERGVPHLVRGPALQRMTAEQLYDSMLVLNRGAVDDTPLAANVKKWNTFTVAVEKLLTGAPRELVALGEATGKAEQAYLDARSEARQLRAKLNETRDADERKKLTELMKAAQKATEENNRMRSPINAASTLTGGDAMASAGMSSMGGMSMTMEEDGAMNNRGREGAARNAARASELSAPFSPGTIVREFGGSDRGTPSSSHATPTVPQALALLNDPATDVIGGKKTILNQRLAKVSSPEERLEIVFLRIYSRLPDAGEKERYAPLAADPNSLRDLTRAMMTSNRFLFVP
ncbi:DUF1549 domain-containing protein [Luteolibacter sp. SL250]|uniref:DUF1549 domain-containing protein n=1 Tax=Luteolibacter sp. SL250 TaxID=2995170 RepID=UPI002270EBD3|nr:DUF1549 domain-containing protein [Luteolibacter sp. SL250]WAC18908.1 DUF1549 domain-containing protein [Luteolibacter sp. SL250]